MKTNFNEVEINGTIYVPKGSESNIPYATADKMQAVLIRSYASGVHFGLLKSREDLLSGIAVELVNSRRVYYWDGACSLSQLAMEGSKCPDKCKIAVPVNLITVSQVIEIIPLTENQYKTLNSYKEWKK